MTVARVALRRPRFRRPERDAFLALCLVVLAPVLGAAVGGGWSTVMVLLTVTAIALAVGISDWRRSVYLLLAYLPFSGIPFVLLYPEARLSALIKDLLFILPAYLGFVVCSGQWRRTELRDFPIALFAIFAVLVVAQVFNPASPSRLVGAIGAKVWLFYIPLCFLGYHLVRDRGDVAKVLGVMSVAAIVPALVGVIEAVFIYAGHHDLVYRWYGDAAASVTQDFAEFNLSGGATLRRVPSTFSFVAQYFAFTVSMSAVTYAWWRAVLARTRLAPLGAAVWLLLLLAGLLSGARAAFLFIPFLAALILVLEGPRARLGLGRITAPAALLVGVAVVILGSSAKAVLTHASETGLGEIGDVFVNGFRRGFELTLTGLGTGVNTNAARHAFAQSDQFTAVNGIWYESWYVKVLLELGVVGLVVVALLLGALVVTVFRNHALLKDPGFRAVSASVLALLIWNVLFNAKAQYMDMDPMNVHFWLLFGLVLKLPVLDAEVAPDGTQNVHG